MSARLEYTSEHRQFRAMVHDFVQQTVVPAHEQWENAGCLDRSLFTEAGKLGLLAFSVPEEFGGPGVDDFRYNAIVVDELQRAGAAAEAIALSLQNDIVLPYLTDLTTAEQQRRWLPDVVNGAKTFISNGQTGDLFVVAVRTSPDRHKGLSLLVVEPETPGFSRGRNLEKIGLHAQDTIELSFADMRVPAENLLGEEGRGFYQLMNNLPQERLSLAVGAVAAAEGVMAETLGYVKQRNAFGSPISGLQNTQFVLAELSTEIDVARTYLDDCIAEHLAGELTAARAARLKWWTTELQVRTADRCLQLHGGYGYMREYPVSRAFVDARIQTIYGGTTEIMKTIIAKDLGL